MDEGGRAMKHKRFSEEKIIGVLKEHEVSIPEQKGSVNRWNNPQRAGSGRRC